MFFCPFVSGYWTITVPVPSAIYGSEIVLLGGVVLDQVKCTISEEVLLVKDSGQPAPRGIVHNLRGIR